MKLQANWNKIRFLLEGEDAPGRGEEESADKPNLLMYSHGDSPVLNFDFIDFNYILETTLNSLTM